MNKTKLTSILLSLSLALGPTSVLADMHDGGGGEPDRPDAREVPDIPEAPAIPEIPEIPKAPEIPKMPAIPTGAPDIPEIPNDELPVDDEVEDTPSPTQPPVYDEGDDDDRPRNRGGSNNNDDTEEDTESQEEAEEVSVPAPIAIEKQKMKDGKTKIKATLDSTKADEMMKEGTDRIKLTVPKDDPSDIIEAVVPSDVFEKIKKKNTNAVVEVETVDGSYNLPVSEIDTATLSKQLGTTEKVEISIQVNEANDDQGSLGKNKLRAASKIVEFKVEAVSGDKRIELNQFKRYVERAIVNDVPFNSETSTAVRLNEDGTVTPVPTLIDGTKATFKSLTNSKYTIVENDKTFEDIQTHWAKDNIEMLASKLIVNGKAEGLFDPNSTLTRAEFTAMVVRALGLGKSNESSASFTDVNTDAWYADASSAAVNAGILKGYNDGTFRPNQPISRQELAVLIQRSMKVAEKETDVRDVANTLSSYSDQGDIAEWAKPAQALMLETNLVQGKPGGLLEPLDNTTRAEAITVLKRFLQYVEFIN